MASTALPAAEAAVAYSGPQSTHAYGWRPVICSACVTPLARSSTCRVVGYGHEPHPLSAEGTVSYATLRASAENMAYPATTVPDMVNCAVGCPLVVTSNRSAPPLPFLWKQMLDCPAPSALSGQLLSAVRSVTVSVAGSMIAVKPSSISM